MAVRYQPPGPAYRRLFLSFQLPNCQWDIQARELHLLREMFCATSRLRRPLDIREEMGVLCSKDDGKAFRLRFDSDTHGIIVKDNLAGDLHIAMPQVEQEE